MEREDANRERIRTEFKAKYEVNEEQKQQESMVVGMRARGCRKDKLTARRVRIWRRRRGRGDDTGFDEHGTSSRGSTGSSDGAMNGRFLQTVAMNGPRWRVTA